MGFMDRVRTVFGREPAKEVAKKRLQLILKYDRAGLPPNAIEAVKEAILNSLREFPFIDIEGVNIHIPDSDAESGKIEIEVPVKSK